MDDTNADEKTVPEDSAVVVADELMLRQINPLFVHDSRVTSQAFKPTLKDGGHLSVSQESLTTAEDAFELYTNNRQLDSSGVMGVSSSECNALGLPIHPDPLLEPVADPAHAYINFSSLGKRPREKASKKLRCRANERGWLFQPAEDS